MGITGDAETTVVDQIFRLPPPKVEIFCDFAPFLPLFARLLEARAVRATIRAVFVARGRFGAVLASTHRVIHAPLSN